MNGVVRLLQNHSAQWSGSRPIIAQVAVHFGDLYPSAYPLNKGMFI